MTLESLMFYLSATRSDKKRDAAIALPTGVTECRDISYGPYGNHTILDVYYPEGTDKPLPTIVSIHGGGYVYGSKEIYRRYGMDMAKRGFAFVNFNYRLAPKWKFPTPLMDTNAVMEWICKNQHNYHLDPQRIIVLGDSAGAQMTSQYAAIWSNPEYAALFGIQVPRINIRAVGLNCGMYDQAARAAKPRKGHNLDYFGRKLPDDDPRLRILESIGSNYPPAYITTAYCDFLVDCAEPMYAYLTERGIPCGWKCYGSPERKDIGHVFHVNIALPEAKQCNDDAAEFFRKYL